MTQSEKGVGHGRWSLRGCFLPVIAVMILWFCGTQAEYLRAASTAGAVVINELHTNPDVKAELVEFVELYNPDSVEIDLGGWGFTEGVFYMFPAGVKLPAGGYLIVAQAPSQVLAKWKSGKTAIPAGRVFGPYGGKLDNEGDPVVLCDSAGNVVDEVTYQLGFPWPTVGDPLNEAFPGSGASMQLINPSLDNDLGGNWRSATPTPAAANSGVFLADGPPCVRQVRHSPQQPRSGEEVTITAKVTDPEGLLLVVLQYQVVEPGNYISRDDPRYGNWTMIDMHDDGLNGDAVANDDVFTVRLPAGVQTHRRLVRYRIAVSDVLGSMAYLPYQDDPQPNFAYFVYDGVPAWSGAVKPGDPGPLGQIVEYSPEVLTSLPVYHLIAKKSDVENCMWLQRVSWNGPDASEFRWHGTLIYDGQVYDHISFRTRGGTWRYAMGKNMWKFDFNRGHEFQARDDYGNEYATKWQKLNFSACIQQGSFGQRGEQGLFEALSFRMFNLAGVPASKTNYVHFRVIDEAGEDGMLNAAHPSLTSSGTQYDGDFWGLYMTIEQPDGRFLDEHGLPDGNLYKMDQDLPGGFDKNNQGPTAVSDNSDLAAFRNAYRSYPSATWWGQNVNLDAYYGYYAIYQAIHHGDITEKNWFLYHNPEATTNDWGTNYLWWQLPWDLDLTWTTYYGSNDPTDPFSRAGILDSETLNIPCRNRLREVVDLLFNSEQMNQLIDEYAAIINDPAGGPSMVDADRAMWDYHWVVSDAACGMYMDRCGSDRAGQGRFYQEAVRRGYDLSFEGMVQVMKDYVVERVAYMDRKAVDPAIPNTPIVTSTAAQGYPVNALTFQVNRFADPEGADTFAAMQWRVGEVAEGSSFVDSTDDVVLVPDGAQWRYFKGLGEPSASPGAWRQKDFDDSQWLQGSAAIGYGEDFIVTNLGDMRYNYSTVYLRRTFEVPNPAGITRLLLETQFDDGVIVWINGKVAFGRNVSATELPYDALATAVIEDYGFISQVLDDPRTWLVQGTNVIAVQVLNAYLGDSSDCFIDLRLIGERNPNVATESTPQVQRRRPGKYEIEPVWQSDELTTFNADVKIPASVVQPGRTYRVRCRMKDNTNRWSHWSSPVQFVTGQPVGAGILADLRLTELMYHPSTLPGDEFDGQEYEFIELKNVGDETLDLSSVSLTNGVAFDFSGGAIKTLRGGQFVLVVKNKPAFTERYGEGLSGLIAGEYTGKLANEGETVALTDYWNGAVAEFEYGDGRGWPVAADGGGHSLVPLSSALLGQPQGSLNYPGNWRASTYMGGSPGRDDPAPPQSLLINEFLASSEAPGTHDWVELYNPTDGDVSLAGWYLSDDAEEPTKYALPASSIPARGCLCLSDIAGFGLSRDGEDLVLSQLPGTSQDRIVDAVPFKAQEPGISLGRYPDGGPYWFPMTPSPGQANQIPIPGVMITAIMYHPLDPNEEYIELHNPASDTVALAGWRLHGGVEHTFPAGASIPAGGGAVVIGFDPQVETSRLAVLLAEYGGPLTPGVNLFGPWQGNLSNGGERLGLEKPQYSGDSADLVAWVIVDEVIYSNVAPWPVGADSAGQALRRVHTDASHSGNDPANWQPASHTHEGDLR